MIETAPDAGTDNSINPPGAAFMLGDMLVLGEPPQRFAKALSVLAGMLHSLFDGEHRNRILNSKASCVLASLAVRDFLSKVGFEDAEVRPVVLAIQAVDASGKQIHSVKCGSHDMAEVRRLTAIGPGWAGHLIVHVPSIGFMVDATLYQAQRPAWADLPGMIAAVTYSEPHAENSVWGLPILSEFEEEQPDGSTVRCAWLDHAENSLWQDVGDATHRKYRGPVVRQLVAAFNRVRN